MVCFTLLRKHLGMTPPSIHLTDITASAWNRRRRGRLRRPTISQLQRPAQAVPATPFGDWRRPLVPSTANDNQNYRPSPWPTLLCRNRESFEAEDTTSKRYFSIQNVGEREAGNEPAKPHILLTTINTEKKGTMSSGQTHQSLLSSRDKSPNETCPKAVIIYTQNVQGLSVKD